MAHSQRIAVVIAAAGSGRRMGSNEPKQFLLLAGKPILVRTVELFNQFPEIFSKVIAVAPDSYKRVEQILLQYHLEKNTTIVVGGKYRQDSVWNALQVLLKDNIDIVLVHDAVRPFVSTDIIYLLLQEAIKHGAAVPAVHPKDTIKLSSGIEIVDTTLEKEKVWLVQTPQVFRWNVLYEALQKAMKENFYSTDESSLVERLGQRVKIVESDYKNIKITTPEDLLLAELLLKEQYF